MALAFWPRAGRVSRTGLAQRGRVTGRELTVVTGSQAIVGGFPRDVGEQLAPAHGRRIVKRVFEFDDQDCRDAGRERARPALLTKVVLGGGVPIAAVPVALSSPAARLHPDAPRTPNLEQVERRRAVLSRMDLQPHLHDIRGRVDDQPSPRVPARGRCETTVNELVAGAFNARRAGGGKCPAVAGAGLPSPGGRTAGQRP
jgi:hypothetical protein